MCKTGVKRMGSALLRIECVRVLAHQLYPRSYAKQKYCTHSGVGTQDSKLRVWNSWFEPSVWNPRFGIVALGTQGQELTSFHPVLVHEQDGLCTAFLSTAGIRILITHPRYIVDVAHIRPQHLPVKASILQKHLYPNFCHTYILSVCR